MEYDIVLLLKNFESIWSFELPFKSIAKGTTDPRVEFISQVLTQIFIKFQLQNPEQVWTSKSQPNMNILTKVKLQNIDQT